MGVIDISKIHNWVAIGATAFVTIGIGMLFSKWLASKNIPFISPISTGILSFWNLTVAA